MNQWPVVLRYTATSALPPPANAGGDWTRLNTPLAVVPAWRIVGSFALMTREVTGFASPALIGNQDAPPSRLWKTPAPVPA
jgi:hypothetical protein